MANIMHPSNAQGDFRAECKSLLTAAICDLQDTFKVASTLFEGRKSNRWSMNTISVCTRDAASPYGALFR